MFSMHLLLRRVISSLVIATAVILTMPTFACAEPSLNLELGNITVTYNSGDAGLARKAGLGFVNARDQIKRDLDIDLDIPIHIIIVRGREKFLEKCGTRMPEWSLAAALPPDTMVLDAAQMLAATVNDIRFVVAHEAAHLALARAEQKGGNSLPRWFHEGISVRIGGQLPMRTNRSIFFDAAAQGTLLSFGDLQKTFPANPNDAGLAYLQSEAFIAYIAKQKTSFALGSILSKMETGKTFDDAFAEVMETTPARLEKQWKQSYKKRFPWLRTIWRVITLLGTLAVATIIAYFIIKKRNKRQHQKWKDEDEMWSVVTAEDEDEPNEDEERDTWY